MLALIKTLRLITLSIFLLCSSYSLSIASHLFGGELFYTYVSGSQYTVTMILYGDCGGTPSVFAQLATATPAVEVYNGSTLYRTMYLKVQAGSGTEVTPICAGSLGSSTCNGGTVPGIKRYVYSDTITIGTSSSWKFRSTGYLTSSSIAGRSGSITNITSPGSSIMSLEATLNNSSAPNSNPSYTTIPTPFFCINVLQQYNHGAIDPNTGDVLVYSLVDGLDATSTPSSLVTYKTGYSATSPLAVAAGTFAFSTSTGQLTFKPNLGQVSLVVCKVSEYRSGVLVGTSMREMNFIVLTTCSNRSPYGAISNAVGGTVSGGTTVDMCKNDTLLTFNINPVDSDGNNITMTVSGLPTGATLTVTGNGTAAPTSAFSWNTKTVAPGTYYFFITFQDDACPLSSKQTVAYTLNILPKPAISFTKVSPASCVKKEVVDITALGAGPWTVGVYSGTTLLRTLTWSTGSVRDSFAVGTYTFKSTSGNGCTDSGTYTVVAPPLVTVKSLFLSNPLCNTSVDGTATVAGGGGLSPYTYNLDAAGFVASGVFTGLSAGSHTIRIMDANSCTKDTTFTLVAPSPIAISSLTTIKPKCIGSADGTATITASGGTSPYTYSVDGGAYSASTLITGLSAGSHTIRVRDANLCTKDTTFTLVDPNPIQVQSLTITLPLCVGSADATATIVATGTIAPYSYNIDGGAFGSTGVFTGLIAGAHTIRIKDAYSCTKDTTFTINSPEPIVINSVVKKSLCNGTIDGAVTVLASGGTSPYTYGIGATGTFGSSNVFGSLKAGTYTFRVKDAHNCIQIADIRVEDSVAIKTSFTLKNVSCFAGNDGAITLSPYTGFAPFNYAIGSGAYGTSNTFSTLRSGTYNFKIKDAIGCTLDTFATITQPPILAISVALNKPSCYGYKDGSIISTGSGGTPPYTYAIDTKAYSTSAIFSSLPAGSYTLHVKDANGCIKDTLLTLTQPTPVYILAKLQSPLCNGDANGIITIMGSGGTPPFTYAYDAVAPQIDSVLTGFKAGAYKLHLIDKNGCIKDSTVTLTEPKKVSFKKILITNPTCEGYADGSVLVSGDGGILPYQYAINSSNFKADSLFAKLLEGSYTLTVRDSNNCKADSIVKLVGYPKIVLDSTKAISTTCYGAADGSFKLYASGGNPPLRYTLKGTKDTFSFASYNQLKSKAYTVTVIDDKNCFKDFTVAVPQPEELKIATSITHNDCVDIDTNGRIIALVNGGTRPYKYLWSTNSNDSFIAQLPNGFYSVRVSDINNCTDSVRVEVFYDNCCTPSIPNAFTPNKDGKNDIFKILYKGDIILKEFSIYNRYGQQVFTTSSITEGWDGNFNGQEEELGVYYYYVRMICGNYLDHEVMLKGDVTLIR